MVADVGGGFRMASLDLGTGGKSSNCIGLGTHPVAILAARFLHFLHCDTTPCLHFSEGVKHCSGFLSSHLEQRFVCSAIFVRVDKVLFAKT